MTYLVRRGEPKDIAHLPAIEAAAAVLYLDVLAETGLTAVMLERTATADDFAAAQAQGMLWVAVDGADHPVGFALLAKLDDWLHLDELDVHPAHGRRGLGTALLDQVCAIAKAEGYAGVTLSTFREVAWNAPFYARRGFVILEEGAWTPTLRQLVAEEQKRGLRTDLRVVMCYRCVW